MFSRLRLALSLSLLFSAMTLTLVFAKGGFDFISITGPNLKEEVRITDAGLTEDFFTFANFYEDRTEAPADPGEGYEIVRYYIDGTHEIIFDRLHYYPDTGFVFYDGIENGESEYDDGWYLAKPETKAVFESALSAQFELASMEKKQPISSDSQAERSSAPSQPSASGSPALPIMIIVGASGIIALLLFAFWRRKPSTR